MINIHSKFSYLMLGVIICVLAIGLSNKVSAATANPATPPSIESLIEKDGGQGRVIDLSQIDDSIPEIYITDVSIDNTSYNAGATIKGSFIIKNASSFNVSDIGYEIDLSGDFQDNGIPKRTYTSESAKEPIFLSANEEKKISFSYTLPSNLGGKDFGFLIQSKSKSGFNFGWSLSSHFNITGGHPYAGVLYSSVDTTDTEYLDYKAHGLQDGPTIYKDKAPQLAFVRFTLENKSKENISVTPHIKVFERDVAGNKLHDKVYDELKTIITPGTNSGDISIDLPNFEYKPGIYAGVVTFEDETGNERADRIDFRYIVGGDVFNIEALSSTKNEVKKGEAFDLSLTYTGTPFDVNATEHPDVVTQVAKVSVTVFSEQDKKVAEAESYINFFENKKQIFSVVALRAAKAMRAEITISRNGQVLGTYDFILSPNYTEIHNQANLFSLKNITYGLIMLVVVFGIGWFLYRKKTNKFLPTLIAVLFIAGGIFTSLPISAEAFVVTYQYTSGCSGAYYPPPIYMSSPTSGQVFNKGQAIYVSGSSVYHVCNNSSSSFYAAVWNWDSTQYQQALIGSASAGYCTYRWHSQSGWHTNVIQCTSHYDKQSYFAFYLTAPQTPGNYKAWVRVDNYNGCAHDITQGYQPYSVLSAPAAPSSTTASCPVPGSAMRLDWGAVPGATYYKIRSDYEGNSWNGLCDGKQNANDVCWNISSPYNYFIWTPGVPGGSYNWWVSACNTSGCSATTYGTDYVCQVPVTCGSSNGQTLYPAPTSNLCGVGTASAVATSSSPSNPNSPSLTGKYYNWACTSGASAAYCSANVDQTSRCGSATSAVFVSGTKGVGDIITSGCNIPYDPNTSATVTSVNVTNQTTGGDGAGVIGWSCTNNTSSVSCSAAQQCGINAPYFCFADNACYASDPRNISTSACYATNNLESINSMSVPALINVNNVCPITWTIDKFNDESRCRIYNIDNPNVGGVSFTPTGLTGTTNPPAINKDTRYRMECWQDGDGTVATSTAEATCRINFKTGEFN